MNKSEYNESKFKEIKQQLIEGNKKTQGRCIICRKFGKNNSVKNKCSKCLKHVCVNHCSIDRICYQCLHFTDEQINKLYKTAKTPKNE